MPKVTIFLTSYNHEKYIRESIDSVLNQTYTDFKLIILDDASTDNSWQIINSYSDDRIRAYRNEINQLADFPEVFPGEAKGEYIAIHHSDDVWETEKLEHQVTFLDQHSEVGAVFTNSTIIGEDGQPFTDHTHFYYNIFNQPNRTRHEWLNYFFFSGNALCHPSLLLRKECYDKCGQYRDGFYSLPDFDMWVRLCFNYEIYVLPLKLVRFRVRDNLANTSSATYENTVRQQFEYLQILYNYQQISCFDELVNIFPTAEKFYRSQGSDLEFILAMIALENSKQWPYHQIFGLQLLFNILQDRSRANNIKSLYNFDMHDFAKLSAKHDFFSIYSRNKLPEIETQRAQIEMQKAENEMLKAENEMLNTENLRINLSKSWRFTRPFRNITSLIRSLKKY
ncbi:MAG: glycosyltransferase [Candidatus Cloacimonetes bacterium]|nr:glycosyltransferase [Candidatus Cloacimonadota bacterium]